MIKYLYRHKGLLLIAVVLFILSPSAKADFMTEEQKIIGTAQKLIKSTVIINPEPSSQGTGFYIAPKRILTNAHVVRGHDKVKLEDKEGNRCSGTVKYKEETLDLAVIETDCKGTPLTLNPNHQIGQTVLVLGHPGDYDYTLSKGIISAKRGLYLQMDAKVNFGNSGGVVANVDGEVVGVVSKRAKYMENVGFAITGIQAIKFLERAKYYEKE